MSKNQKSDSSYTHRYGKRLIRDVKNIRKNPLSSDGIYYVRRKIIYSRDMLL